MRQATAASEGTPLLPPGRGGKSASAATTATAVASPEVQLSRLRRRRVFIDPALIPVPDEDEDEDDQDPTSKDFRYLVSLKKGVVVLSLRSLWKRAIDGSTHTILVTCLLFLAVFVDGIRPISLLASKDSATSKYPFWFSAWILVVKGLVVGFSWAMSRISKPPTQVNEDDLSFKQKLWLSKVLILPVVCYLTSDLLVFVALERGTTASLLSVMKQSRLAITAMLFRFGLHRILSPFQWIAVFQLSVASLLFVVDDLEHHASKNPMLSQGMWIVLFKCFLDSLAVVWSDLYFKSLEKEKFKYADQQLFYAVYSFLVGLLFFVTWNGREWLVEGRSLFQGFNAWAWGAALLAAGYGMLASLVLRYLDAMYKMMQSLGAVVVTLLIEATFWNEDITVVRAAAVAFVLSASLLYKLGTPRHAPVS